MQKLVLGKEVSYKITDSRGKDQWRNGVIHAIRKVENGETERVVSYVIDTGKDASVDEMVYDERQVEVSKRVNAQLEKSDLTGDDRIAASMEISKEVLKQKDLPKSELKTHTLRHPELVEVYPGNVKPAGE